MRLPRFSSVGFRLVAAIVACATAGACSPSGEDAAPTVTDVASRPPEPALRRLLAKPYRRSVALLLGEQAALAASPPDDTQLNGYASIAATQLSFNDSLVAAYELSARKVASAAMLDSARIDALLGCTPKGDVDPACATSFVERFGRLAWRRPLTTDERDDYVDLLGKGATARKDFRAGVELVIAAMLASPPFVYQVEVGHPDPSRTDVRLLDGYEMAARLSFLLLGRTPDATLLDAAAHGELDGAAGVRAWAEALLAKPEAAPAIRDFFSEFLALDGLATLPKDPNLFPEFSPSLAASMREEALRIVEDVIARDASIVEVLTTRRTFVDSALAAVYGIAPLAEDWQPTTLPDEQGRTGVLTSAAVMSRQAHATSTSATYRGLFVMERLLCTTMPPPPPGVVTTLPPSSEAPTLRDRLAVHLTDDKCRGCHYISDNIGLTFERFDAIGRYRNEENGVAIDPSGEVDLIGAWSGPRDLAEVLSASDEVKRCILRQLYRYATGHVEIDGELAAIDELFERWSSEQHRFRSLLVSLVSHDLFRHVGAMK